VPRHPDEFAAALGLAFRDPGLLRVALTHRSAGGANYERLEFLGDAVLGMLIAEAVFRGRPSNGAANGKPGDRPGDRPDDEGALSRLRASLVNERSLAAVATELGLGEVLTLGPGELKSGGFRRESILADAYEALIGAVYLDAGIDAARALVLRNFATRLANLPDPSALKDPKTKLQEKLQGEGRGLPEYSVVAIEGADHEQTFRVRCALRQPALTADGAGRSRREAEQSAAAALLGLLATVGPADA
jgi:ribonuclease-3